MPKTKQKNERSYIMYLHSNGKDNIDVPMESSRPNYEFKFAQAIVDIICNVLRVTSRDRRIIEALLLEKIEPLLAKRGGLLEQYLHTQLDILADTLKEKFELSDDVSINYDYTTHAKFNDIIKAIKEKYKTC